MALMFRLVPQKCVEQRGRCPVGATGNYLELSVIYVGCKTPMKKTWNFSFLLRKNFPPKNPKTTRQGSRLCIFSILVPKTTNRPMNIPLKPFPFRASCFRPSCFRDPLKNHPTGPPTVLFLNLVEQMPEPADEMNAAR